ncbi:unnamed protein product [Aspergillus oryzae RIB40]|uniref:DNA, SC113 n=1 Tax=Aspergillus oryzae (strain ATCC 42149 / RIB 40) TaxID=510516 RepID=Q2U5M2_ASPOR|nr:unnamed protein product [Aspergillus oryzae RIB40]BAE63143.1 unnamed protein product [Aspergillus oryzae RIB40]
MLRPFSLSLLLFLSRSFFSLCAFSFSQFSFPCPSFSFSPSSCFSFSHFSFSSFSYFSCFSFSYFSFSSFSLLLIGIENFSRSSLGKRSWNSLICLGLRGQKAVTFFSRSNSRRTPSSPRWTLPLWSEGSWQTSYSGSLPPRSYSRVR